MVQITRLFGSRQEVKLLEIFLKNPTTKLSTGSAIKKAGLAKATALRWLAFLFGNGLILREQIGRTKLYSLNRQDYFARQLKKFYNATSPQITELVGALKGKASKIVLFGSFARGEDRTDSDVDIFAVSNYPEVMLKKIAAQLSKKHGKKISLAIKTPEQFLQMSKAEDLLWKKTNIEGVLLYGD